MKMGCAVVDSSKAMPGFEYFQRKTSAGVVVSGVVAGSGRSVALLNGAPANPAGWRKTAPALAGKCTVVAIRQDWRHRPPSSRTTKS